MENLQHQGTQAGDTIFPLRTHMEHKAAVETVEVYTVPVPAKKANLVVNAFREVLPPQNKSRIDLQHLRRLVREEFLPKHVLSRMKLTAVENSLTLKTDPECAIVDTEGDIISEAPSHKSRTSSSGSNNSSTSQRSVLMTNHKSIDTNITTVDATVREEQKESVPKKKPKRRSSAERRAARREREKVALQKLKALDINQKCPDIEVPCPPSSPTVAQTIPAGALEFQLQGKMPVINSAPVENTPSDENTPPTANSGAASRRRRRRLSTHKRLRAGSTESTSSTSSLVSVDTTSTDGGTISSGCHHSAAAGTSSPKCSKKTVKQNLLHLLIAPVSVISLTTVYNILRPLLFPSFPDVSTIEAPLHPSISQEQADEWSAMYWPTIYKRGNPFGPHPPFVEQTIKKILPNVAEYMALVKEAARQAKESGNGIEAAALVVDPSNEQVIAIAGDGREMSFGSDDKAGCSWGNPLDHSVLRVVGMVAAKRKLREDLGIGVEVGIEEGIKIINDKGDTIRHTPRTDIERKYFYSINPNQIATVAIFTPEDSNATTSPGEGLSTDQKRRELKDTGEYLCHNHIVYLTHEPCVMCSMALIHSRIGMVVIDGTKKAAYPGWGGLYVGGSQHCRPAGELVQHQQKKQHKEIGMVGNEGEKAIDNSMGAGYGLFWRKELNWKFLAFEWIEDGHTPKEEIEGHHYYV